MKIRVAKRARSAGIGSLLMLVLWAPVSLLADEPDGFPWSHLEARPEPSLGLLSDWPIVSRESFFSNSDDLPGYPLTSEELSLVLDATKTRAFPDGSSYQSRSAESGHRPVAARVLHWLRKRSSDLGLFNTLFSQDSRPGVHVDLDPVEEEIILLWSKGF